MVALISISVGCETLRLFVLRFLAYICEKIVVIFAPAIATEDVEYEHEYV